MHLLMCAQANRHTLQLALCGGGVYTVQVTIYPTNLNNIININNII